MLTASPAAGEGRNAVRSRISTDYFAVSTDATVAAAIDEVRKRGKKFGTKLSYLYVEDPAGRLAGVLRTRDLLVNAPDQLIKHVMQKSVISIAGDASRGQVLKIFQNYSFLAVPVVDSGGRLAGVISRKDIPPGWDVRSRAIPLYRVFPISQEEVEQRPVIQIVMRRTPWLAITIFSGMMLAYILGIFIGPLESVVALVFFLPVVLGFSGSMGTQSAAVTTRGLEENRLSLRWLARVLGKEFAIGALLAAISCVLAGAIAILWKKPPVVGMALGVSLFAGMSVSALLGMVLPILFRTLKISRGVSGLFLLLICDIVAAVTYFLVAVSLLGPSIQVI